MEDGVIGVVDDGETSGREGEEKLGERRGREGGRFVATGVGSWVAVESGRYATRSGLASALHLPC